MIGSLFTGITGLQSFQQQMNVVANNIANVNTVGFKGAETIFESMLSQNLASASAPTALTGGSDPKQIGLGTQITSIVPIFTQGGSQTTNKPTDMMIQGNGFFVMQSNGSTYYTRDGAFDRDANGDLVNPATGMMVMGFQAQGNPPTINAAAPLGPVNIPSTYASFGISNTGVVSGVSSTGQVTILGQVALATFPNPSGLQSLGNNLWQPTINSGQPSTTTNTTPQFAANTNVIIGQPGSTPLAAVPSITVPAAATAPAAATVATAGGFTLPALPAGVTLPITSMQISFDVTAANTIANQTLTLNGVALPAAALTVAAGPPATFQINGTAGTLTVTVPAGFPAAAVGNGYMINLGGTVGQTNLPGTNGTGTITPGALEMSNVDLSREFSNMIIAERGFQANSKTITTSDSILTTLVNMKGQ
jgi:flagellar hook protein FlgE